MQGIDPQSCRLAATESEITVHRAAGRASSGIEAGDRNSPNAGPNAVPTKSAAVAAAIQARLGPDATVTNISITRTTVGSSPTAVDLTGLTRVELAFALRSPRPPAGWSSG